MPGSMQANQPTSLLSCAATCALWNIRVAPANLTRKHWMCSEVHQLFVTHKHINLQSCVATHAR